MVQLDHQYCLDLRHAGLQVLIRHLYLSIYLYIITKEVCTKFMQETVSFFPKVLLFLRRNYDNWLKREHSKNDLACQHDKLRNPRNFVASAGFRLSWWSVARIYHADFLIHQRNLADATGSVRISEFDMKPWWIILAGDKYPDRECSKVVLLHLYSHLCIIIPNCTLYSSQQRHFLCQILDFAWSTCWK